MGEGMSPANSLPLRLVYEAMVRYLTGIDTRVMLDGGPQEFWG